MLGTGFGMLGADFPMLGSDYAMLVSGFGMLDAKIAYQNLNQEIFFFLFSHRLLAAV